MATRISMPSPTNLPRSRATDEFLQKCAEDYVVGEITTLAYLNPSSRTPIHMLGVVELLPKELERNPNVGRSPEHGGYPRRLPISNRAGMFLVQRWHRTV